MLIQNIYLLVTNLLLVATCQEQSIYLKPPDVTLNPKSHPWVPKPLKSKSTLSHVDSVRKDVFHLIPGPRPKAKSLSSSNNVKQRLKRTVPFWDCALTLCAFQYSRIVAYRNTVFLGPLYDMYKGHDVEKIQKTIKKHRESVDKAAEAVKMFKKKTDMRKKLFELQLENRL